MFLAAARPPHLFAHATAALAAALLCLALPGTLAVPASAAPSAEPPSGEVLVIMDVSGSMDRKDSSGTTLIDGARRAVNRLVDQAPEEAAVGLRLYGSEYAGDSRAQGCRDSRLVVPIGALSETGDSIRDAIDRARPTGFTPIGHSLEQAAKDFSSTGQRSIVLVSDGEDTCGDPEPCAAARQLSGQGIDVRVDTVGLFLQDNPKARRQLQCIARATGGAFHRADDAEALGQQLTAVSTRAIQSFDVGGEEITGGPAATQASPVEPGTAYRDDIRSGEARWYRVEVEEGQHVRVVLTESGATDYGCCLNLRLKDPRLDRVNSDIGFNTDRVAASYVVETGSWGASTSGPHYIEVMLDKGQGKGLVEYELAVEVTAAEPTETATPTPSEEPSESQEPVESASPAESAGPNESAESGDTGGNGLLWGIIGVLGVLVLALGGTVLVLFRKVSGTP